MEEIDIEHIIYCEHTRRTAEARYETNPLDADNLTKWGAVLLEFSRFQNGPQSKKMVQDAIEKLEEALVVNPEKHDALWVLGNAYTAKGILNPDLDEATGSFDQAAQHFELAYELQPQNMNYKSSLEAVSKALEVHADIHKHGFAQQAMGPGPSSSTSTKQQSNKKSENSDLKYDICGWIILFVGIFTWVGFGKSNMPPPPPAR